MTQTSIHITEADSAILRALARFYYLTAAQASRLLYPNLNDQNRYMQRRLKKLSDAGYVLRLRALPTPRYGQAPHVFTLAGKGRQYMSALGELLPTYFRPSEEAKAAENHPFMTHRLAALDVLIAAELLCGEQLVSCPRMLTERELKPRAIRVEVPAGPNSLDVQPRRVAVIPDGWFQLSVAGDHPYSIALELDRGTEDQRVWRQKIAAYGVWAQGPYQRLFETDNLTVAVVCPDVRRRAQLAAWTEMELSLRSLDQLKEIFLFTATSPVETSPQGFFFGRRWHSLSEPAALSLLDPPQAGNEVFAVSHV